MRRALDFLLLLAVAWAGALLGFMTFLLLAFWAARRWG